MSQTKHWHSVRDYEILRAMITTGTTVAASQRLAVSQSTVSRALSTLEERVGYTLFTRDSNRLQPTAEALRLNASLDGLFNVLSDIEGRIQPEPVGSLRIAGTTTLAHMLLQPMVVSFLRQTGIGSVSLDVGSTDMLLDGVADGRFDIGVSDRDIQRAGVRVTPFRRSHIACVMPAGHKLASRTEIRPDDLAETDFVAATKRLSTQGTPRTRFFGQPESSRRPSWKRRRRWPASSFIRQGIGLALLNSFPIAAGLPKGPGAAAVSPRDGLQNLILDGRRDSDGRPGPGLHPACQILRPSDPWSEAI